jgi:hypothetical protein
MNLFKPGRFDLDRGQEYHSVATIACIAWIKLHTRNYEGPLKNKVDQARLRTAQLLGSGIFDVLVMWRQVYENRRRVTEAVIDEIAHDAFAPLSRQELCARVCHTVASIAGRMASLRKIIKSGTFGKDEAAQEEVWAYYDWLKQVLYSLIETGILCDIPNLPLGTKLTRQAFSNAARILLERYHVIWRGSGSSKQSRHLTRVLGEALGCALFRCIRSVAATKRKPGKPFAEQTVIDRLSPRDLTDYFFGAPSDADDTGGGASRKKFLSTIGRRRRNLFNDMGTGLYDLLAILRRIEHHIIAERTMQQPRRELQAALKQLKTAESIIEITIMEAVGSGVLSVVPTARFNVQSEIAAKTKVA